MKWLRDVAQTLGVVLLAAVLSELPGLKQAGQAIDRRHDPLRGVTIGLTALGFTVFMGGILRMLMASGKPMIHKEVEDAISRRRSAGNPVVWRASAHRVFGVAAGRQVATEDSFAGMKEAWRSGEWRRDPHWRRLFLVASGAGLMMYGLFGLFVVIAPGPIKVIATGALLYATVMTARGFARA
jgi:hypothetical protein